MDKRLALTIQFAAADKLSGALRSISGLADKGGRAIGKLTRQSRASSQTSKASLAAVPLLLVS